MVEDNKTNMKQIYNNPWILSAHIYTKKEIDTFSKHRSLAAYQFFNNIMHHIILNPKTLKFHSFKVEL